MKKKSSAKVWFYALGQRAAAIGGFASLRQAALANRILKNDPRPLSEDDIENGVTRGLPGWAKNAFRDGFLQLGMGK